jgi:hypothetical protein
MIGKSRKENLPKPRDQVKRPLNQVNMDIVSSSVPSLEGHKYALVLTDCFTGYRWLYDLKTKDEVLPVMKKWYSDIADLRDKHKLFVVMRDNSGKKYLVNFSSQKASRIISAPLTSNGKTDNLNRQSTRS